jgi:hypothetical protein
LGIDGDLLDVTSVVLRHIWRFQPHVQSDIDAAIVRVGLPVDYNLLIEVSGYVR